MINASMLINKSLDVQQDLPPDAQILDLRSWPFQYGHVHTVLHRTIDHIDHPAPQWAMYVCAYIISISSS